MPDLAALRELGYTDTIVERLNSRLGRVPSGCLIWLGARRKFGYGVISRGGRGTGVEVTHRVAWILANGPIPDGMFVCHHCDTAACCEPTHLYLGTAATNYADMRQRGRIVALRGEASPRCTISDELVRQMRAEYTGRWGDYSRIGRKYGVDTSYARNIIGGYSRTTA